MKYLKIAFFILFFFSLAGVKAQQNHFIYIQTENKQPFYVKLDKNIYSSSESGYLVVPKLKEGEYQLAIGFPKSEWTEQNMPCTVGNNDVGYLLKNLDSKGWGLFNLQTLAVTMTNDTPKAKSAEVINKTDAFSNMLSTVVNDSTIMQTEKAVEVKKVPAPVKEQVQATMAANINDTADRIAVIEQTKTSPGNETKAGLLSAQEKATGQIAQSQENAVPELKSVIVRNSLNKSSLGTELTFIDEANGKRDTIVILIPVEINSPAITGQKDDIKKEAEAIITPALKIEEKASDTAMVVEKEQSRNRTTSGEKNILKDNPEGRLDTLKVQTGNTAGATGSGIDQKAAMINSDCKNSASDDDFMKLRKKMAAAGNDDDMVIVAKKIFKTKCFTVEQVKNLSVLFLKDSGKYAFYDMAYPFVSDSHNFSSLQNQLSEAYYINRFQVMIRH